MTALGRRGLVEVVLRAVIGFAALLNTSVSGVVAQATAVQNTASIPGFAESLELIRDLLDRGRGIEAENIARALLARVEDNKGSDALEVAEVLDLLGRAVRRSSRVKEEDKRAFAERAVAIKERLLGPAHPDLAASLINLGVQRTLAGDPASARPLLERALAIREAAFGPDHPSVTGALQSLAGLLMTLHDDDGAKMLLERAQRSRERLYGPHDPGTIRTLVNLAILYQETGDYTGARQHYTRAVLLAEKITRPTEPLTLHVLTGLAVVLSDLNGDFAASAKLNERVLALVEQSFGATDVRLRTPLQNLAMDRRDLGDYTAAKELAERALSIAEREFGPKHAEVAASLHTLATVLAGLGDYSAAMRLFERATAINEAVLQPSNPEHARAAWFIRDLLPLSGYGSDDLDLFERVLAARERQGGLAHPGTSESLSNLAAVLSSAEDSRRTRPLFERALESQERFLGPDHPEVGAAAFNLATVLSRSGEDELAGRLYERALSIWGKSLGADHPKVATGLVNLARLYLRTGKYSNAAPLLARALAIQEKGLGPEHPEVAVTLSSRAELEAHTGAVTEAFRTAARAEAVSREHLRLSIRTLPERQALAYAASRPFAFDLMVHLAATHPDNYEMLTTSWDAVIRARAMVLDEVAARNRSARAERTPEIAELATAVTSARQRLAALAVRGIRNDPPERYRLLLEQARAEKDRGERALAERSARFRHDQSSTGVLLADVSAALPASTALVSFVRSQGHGVEPSYLAFVLRDGGGRPALVPLGSASRIDALVVQWRQQLDREAMGGGRGGSRGEAAYRRVAGALRQRIWDPLLAHLSDAKRVFVVPDGVLHLVSFAGLPADGSRYVVDTGPVIHYLSAERDLVLADAAPVAGRGLLALGGPGFDAPIPAPGGPAPSFRGARSDCPDFQSARFDPLPASLKEVDNVVTLWTQAHADTTEPNRRPDSMPSAGSALRLTGVAASESAFKTQAGGRRVLHLATHGFFLGDRCPPTLDPSEWSSRSVSARVIRENPLLMSGLILAGANQRNASAPDAEDGVLTAEEVAALDLTGVEWAVLSGCDTGAGEVRAGEGVFGLRRAFQVAGARTVIMSLWPVEDQATRQWMTALYEKRFVKNLSTVDAVRQAGLSVLAERRSRRLSTHPFYWAAFVAAGDWR